MGDSLEVQITGGANEGLMDEQAQGSKENHIEVGPGDQVLHNIGSTLKVVPLGPDGKDVNEHKYSCNFCKMRFKSWQALGGHQNAHKEERLAMKEKRKRRDYEDYVPIFPLLRPSIFDQPFRPNTPYDFQNHAGLDYYSRNYHYPAGDHQFNFLPMFRPNMAVSNRVNQYPKLFGSFLMPSMNQAGIDQPRHTSGGLNLEVNEESFLKWKEGRIDQPVRFAGNVDLEVDEESFLKWKDEHQHGSLIEKN